jgi:hypothetical protein
MQMTGNFTKFSSCKTKEYNCANIPGPCLGTEITWINLANNLNDDVDNECPGIWSS